MYQPTLGRFLSRDPLSPDGVDVLYDDNNWFGAALDRMRNLYGYCADNPLKFVDPSGWQAEEAGDSPIEFDWESNWLPCVCAFKGRTGKLFIACSCKGLPMWVISEEGHVKAFTPKCGEWYDADGFVLYGQVFKIDGSTCVTLRCTSSQVGGITIVVPSSSECCVNTLAACLGKKCPYPVPTGTFGNEPPADARAFGVLPSTEEEEFAKRVQTEHYMREAGFTGTEGFPWPTFR